MSAISTQNLKDKASEIKNIIEEKKKFIFFSIFILFILIMCYVFSKKNRLLASLLSLQPIEKYVLISSDLNSEINMDKKLCDFYVASAFRPYIIKNQYLDYIDLQMVKKLLKLGVRCMYIDIFNSSFTEDAYPVISVGFKKGQWKLSLNKIKFDDFCRLIAITAFSSGFVNNPDDPFILCLNLHTQGNLACLNKIKKIIYKRFERFLLDNRYTYSQVNIGEIPIKEFMRKIIILCSDGYQSSELEELINYSWNKSHVSEISYHALDPSVIDTKVIKLSSSTLKDTNKHNLTIVLPEEESLYTYSYKPDYFWDAGCQFVCINYTNIDSLNENYITKFRYNSFILKDSKMRTPLKDKSKNDINLKINDKKYEDLSIYNPPTNCPERPSEDYIKNSDLVSYRDDSDLGLCFPMKKLEPVDCNCDPSTHKDCVSNNFFSQVIYDAPDSFKLCCANNKIIDPLPKKKKEEYSQDNSVEDQKSKLFLSPSKKSNNCSEFEIRNEKGNMKKYYICEINKQEDITNKTICLIDRNDNIYKKCPTGWTFKEKLDEKDYKAPLNICCKSL